MPRPPPLRAVLITGFLGAGKTTLLNRILAATHELRTAVLVNDFGDVSIDASLIVDVRGDTIVLSNGCICCSVRGDLLGAVEALQLAPEPDRVERVVVEASGIADPRVLLSTFTALDRASTVQLECVVSVVDASAIGALEPRDLSLARDQLDQADWVIVNKVDAASEAELTACRAEVRRFAGAAPQLEVSYADVPLEVLLDASPRGPRALTHEAAGALEMSDDERGALGTAARVSDRDELASSPAIEIRDTDEIGGSAEVSDTDDVVRELHHGFSSLTLRLPEPLDLTRLRAVITDLPRGVYRFKGLLWLRQHPDHQVVLQGVGGRARVDRGAPFGSGPHESVIVLIGRTGSFDREDVTARFTACQEPASRPEPERGPLAWLRRYARWVRRGGSDRR
ncbi:MAG: GTP-binding protein [Polyangiaceae bacterium]|nr:GTP-binding protein [Polyangiaceae bacterium]MCW5791330.1 GTP-binding protein [Polyangiaceae bacterium]